MTTPALGTMESVLIKGDLSKLSEDQRAQYYLKTCESIGVNPLTKPFEYITLNGKLVLYATRACTDQLRTLKKVSITLSEPQVINETYIVRAKASDEEGRTDESSGAVSIKGLYGDNLANAYMKAETKAKRRVTLSICGLGMLDESELDTIPRSQPVAPPPRAITNGDGGVRQAVRQEAPISVNVTVAEQPMYGDLADDNILKFGKHKGARWGDVPVGYLKWWSEQPDSATKNPPLYKYAEQRMEEHEAHKEAEAEDQSPPPPVDEFTW